MDRASWTGPRAACSAKGLTTQPVSAGQGRVPRGTAGPTASTQPETASWTGPTAGREGERVRRLREGVSRSAGSLSLMRMTAWHMTPAVGLSRWARHGCTAAQRGFSSAVAPLACAVGEAWLHSLACGCAVACTQAPSRLGTRVSRRAAACVPRRPWACLVCLAMPR
jgi:hypothetical protein